LLTLLELELESEGSPDESPDRLERDGFGSCIHDFSFAYRTSSKYSTISTSVSLFSQGGSVQAYIVEWEPLIRILAGASRYKIVSSFVHTGQHRLDMPIIV
jgi:hypothetical protein